LKKKTKKTQDKLKFILTTNVYFYYRIYWSTLL